MKAKNASKNKRTLRPKDVSKIRGGGGPPTTLPYKPTAKQKKEYNLSG